MRDIIHRNPGNRGRQKGAITMFSAVLILILLTEMVFYAVQVGIFEQRKSGNEMLQKRAFHTADSGIQVAKQFMSAHSTLASSPIEDQRADGADGWLSAAGLRWQPCSGATTGTTGTHPCFGEPIADLRNGSYFYSFEDDATDNDFDLPLDPAALSASGTENVTLHALLCMLEVDRSLSPPVRGCTTDPDKQDRRYFIITLLARGQADCESDGTNCGAEALIAEKIGSYGPGGNDGGSGAPLTARTSVPLGGTVEIVPNPNGGGVGVPISSWVNASTGPDASGLDCSLGADPISPDSGSYATCEAHEWYGQDIRPDDYKCPTNTCSCDPSKDRMLTYAQGSDRQMGMDIVPDPNFPCDLWKYTFGKSWEEVRDDIDGMPGGRLLTDCSSLDASSEGVYWVSGPTCTLQDQVGGKDNPVLLISAAGNTRVNAGAEVFGILFVTDKEVSGAEFTGNGHATIYGAAIMDATMEHFNGTFQIVWVDNVVELVLETGLFGAVAGGWTDFHASWR